MSTAEERVRARLRVETPFYAENCVTIVDQNLRRVPLVAKPAQLRFDQALEEQRLAGKPMRALILKARKMGFSTWVVAKTMQRVTQQQDHVGLVIAQDNETAKTLLRAAELMHGLLPEDEIPGIKPPIASQRSGKEMRFGERSRNARERGLIGLNSSLTIDTAKEFEAKRGFTCHTLHCSEVAFWPDIGRKLTSLLNTVPDSPETMIVLESTAQGHNEWKDLWDRAYRGESDFAAVFFPWFEDPEYVRKFANDSERQDFVESIGNHEYGEAEPELVEMGVTPEQLNWRRWAISNRVQGDLRKFQQEYPSTAPEAFLSTGRHIFDPARVNRVVRLAETTDKVAEHGVLEPSRRVKMKTKHGYISRPMSPKWKDKKEAAQGYGAAYWKVWERPKQDGQYIVSVDPAGDEMDSEGNSAYYAIQVVNHETRVQAARHRSRWDADLVADEAFMAAQFYNNAWLVIESTGGYGLAIVKRAWEGYKYPFTYRRPNLASHRERTTERLGFDTNRQSKPLLEAGMVEMLRDGTHGIQDLDTALELTTYVKDSTGKSGPAVNKFADLLMAYMIAQRIADEKPLRSQRKPGESTSTGRGILNPVTGYRGLQ